MVVLLGLGDLYREDEPINDILPKNGVMETPKMCFINNDVLKWKDIILQWNWNDLIIYLQMKSVCNV